MPKNFDAPSHEKMQCDCEEELPIVLTIQDLKTMLSDALSFRELHGTATRDVCIVVGKEDHSRFGWKITTLENNEK